MTDFGDAGLWRINTFIVPPGSICGGACSVSGREGHHGADVMRIRVGDTVRLIDGTGEEALARVDAVSDSTLECTVTETRTHDRSGGVALTVAQALLKGRGYDDVVRKLSELGVAGIIPLVTERAIGRIPPDALESRLERWRGIAAAAVKQSRGVFLPEVAEPVDLGALAATAGQYDLVLVAWEDEAGATLRDILSESAGVDAGHAVGDARSILLIVGPEGGLSENEVAVLKDTGAVSVSVGRRVLKADWAAAAIASMISYELGGLLP